MQSKTNAALVSLINAYTDLCPTDKDKDNIRTCIADMRKEGEPELSMCRVLAAGIYDGLAYGNWLSAIAEMQLRKA